MKNIKQSLLLTAVCSSLLLSACSNSGSAHRPIVDGGDLTNYETDFITMPKRCRATWLHKR